MSEALPASALVVGLARQGRAAALALARHGVRVVGVDRSEEIEVGELEDAGIDVQLGDEPSVGQVDVIVKSGGVPNEFATALGGGAPMWSDVEVAFRILPNPFLGVTGTNGKTTTCALLGAIFEAAGREAAVAGNIGYAVCALNGELEPDAWIVCELSSFQLEWIERFRPRIGVLLNLEPDHLDRHASFEDYAQAKLRIFEHQLEDDWAIVPRGFRELGRARRVEFDSDAALPAEPLIRGPHNRENAAAATAAARAAGIADDPIARALASFPGVPHRLEDVAEIGGVAYVNDSKATNVAAARPALLAYADEPVHLILGGSLKGESFDGLARSIGTNVKRAYLIGEATESISAALQASGKPHERVGDLAGAVRAAAAAAEPGDVVLLSPACASYDQFENFEQRGDEFRRLVGQLEPR